MMTEQVNIKNSLQRISKYKKTAWRLPGCFLPKFLFHILVELIISIVELKFILTNLLYKDKI